MWFPGNFRVKGTLKRREKKLLMEIASKGFSVLQVKGIDISNVGE